MSPLFHIAVLPGDGIGPEVTTQAMRVLRAVASRLPAPRFETQEHPAGAQCQVDRGCDMPDATWAACRSAHAIFLGAMGLPGVRRPDGTEIAPQVDLRRELDLYAGVRPIYLYHPDHCPLKGYQAGQIDLVLVRESTEGLFASYRRGRRVSADTAVDELVITRGATQRVVRTACEWALARQRGRHVTCVDKANVFASYAFFREVFDQTAAQFRDIRTSHEYVDAMALHLVRRPQAFDVLVTENMFGDILSDLAAGLVGGMGMAPSGDIGAEHAVFQPAHGTAPDIAGRDVANPIAAILSVAMMLEHLAIRHEQPPLAEGAQRIRRAVTALFADTPRTTPDLGGKMNCTQVGEAICAQL